MHTDFDKDREYYAREGVTEPPRAGEEARFSRARK